ncbi:MAG: STAS domain-containing protein [Christensenellaceae bacterium]|jgi:anti-sigma B factor antagonist
MKVEKQFDEIQNVWIVFPEGYVDLYTMPDLEEALEEIPAGEGDIVLSCEALAYMDSSSIKTLVRILQEKKEAGATVTIRKMKSYIYRLFEMTGLDKAFQIEEVEEVEE